MKAQPDIEEIGANLFLVRDSRANTLLKREGELSGNRFVLTTWRRDGLIARLRDHGFRVLTIEDRIRTLPRPPEAPVLGAPLPRTGAPRGERLSTFDTSTLSWRKPAGEAAELMLRPGEPVRRRKGRGPAEFMVVRAEHGGAGLEPLPEGRALLLAYALAAEAAPQLSAGAATAEGALVPPLDLPPDYRDVLERIARATPAGWLVSEASWSLACSLFARLGVELRAGRQLSAGGPEA